MKLSGISRVLLASVSLVLTPLSFAQVQPVAGCQEVAELPTIWDVFMGGSLARSDVFGSLAGTRLVLLRPAMTIVVLFRGYVHWMGW